MGIESLKLFSLRRQEYLLETRRSTTSSSQEEREIGREARLYYINLLAGWDKGPEEVGNEGRATAKVERDEKPECRSADQAVNLTLDGA